ncbi:MAG TPA: DUF429 domain-containing protein [Candidatus Binataceae bacterium]|jgi:hypothetical protein|nr:DUF429 domain-containing protein [Candidatus Binataceae bacterium]
MGKQQTAPRDRLTSTVPSNAEARGYRARLPRFIAGIDVGEDFLDFAIVDRRRRRIEFARLDVRAIATDGEVDPLDDLTRRLEPIFDGCADAALALVDSPRWPRDLDSSQSALRFRVPVVPGRLIDERLRRLAADVRTAGLTRLSLAMFPTPPLAYFLGQISAVRCKPHLRALGSAMFATRRARPQGDPGGGTFTRFMIVGFAVYRALERIGVRCYEGFPDLQFRLWHGNRHLPSKVKAADRRAALNARLAVVTTLAARLGLDGAACARTLDQADAAILALSAAAPRLVSRAIVIEHQAEGRFWLTLPSFIKIRLILRGEDKKL